MQNEDFSVEFIKVATIDNGIEAQLLESILEENAIPHRIQSYHDTAYDGLFQTQKGWGAVFAPSTNAVEIKELLDNIRKGDQEEERPNPKEE